MAWVIVPPGLTDLTEGQDRIEVTATNALGAIDELEQRFPGVAGRLDVGHSVVVDGTLHASISTIPLNDDSEVRFVPSIAGG